MPGKLESLVRIAGLSVAVTLLATSIAAAQTPESAPPGAVQRVLGTAAFENLIRGKRIVVTTSDGREHEGVFTVSATGLIDAAAGTAAVVPYDQIVKVVLVTHHVRKWVLIGLVTGAGVGVVVAINDRGGNLAPLIPAVVGGYGAGVGAAIGAVVNVAHRNTDVVYDAKRRTTTLSLSPILSPTRKGLTLSMTWR